MKNIFNKLRQKELIIVSAIVFLIILLAYGLLSPRMGFYWDDWPFAWFLKFFGPTEFIESFRPFRPFLGPIFTVTTALFGGDPFTWQLVGLTFRFLLSLEIWYVLRLVWPAQKWNTMWVVLLFTVYPGYQQQWVSLTHINQEIIPLTWLIASFGVTTYAIRNEHLRKRLTVLALILQAMGLFATEYFFGLEILRFAFLLAIFAEASFTRKDVLKKAAFSWLPYFCVWILNAAWIYTYHHSAAYSSYGINILSGASLAPLAIGNEILTTISLSGFISWLNTFSIISTMDGSLTQIISVVILLISTSVIFIFMRFLSNGTTDQRTIKKDSWGQWAMSIGLVAIFAGRLPSWAAGLPLKLEFDYDRFFISIMFGASIFIVGLADFILKDGKRKVFILSLLIGMSTAYQFSIANTYRRDTANQQDFFWQLAWRIPALEKNTALLTYELPIKYVSDIQLTAPLNWVYAPQISDRSIPHVLLYLKTRFNPATFQDGQPIDIKYRTVDFNGSTSNSIVIYKEADGCLRVLDSIYANADTVPGANYFLLNAIPLSNPDLIQTKAPQPVMDESLFGAEPAHGWCYFYEKAELARQQNDWEQVVKLYDQAGKNGFSASMPVENLPFIEAFALTGDTNTAIKLTERTIKEQNTLCPALYTVWNRAGSSDEVEIILKNGCKP
ncbi:MAG: hypothetical protein HY863_03890 [Chloroflexi bacterium]|nr:hypothetical protein [Chloroflexota bacterium]